MVLDEKDRALSPRYLAEAKQKRDENEGTQGNDEGSRGMKEQNNGENQEA